MRCFRLPFAITPVAHVHIDETYIDERLITAPI